MVQEDPALQFLMPTIYVLQKDAKTLRVSFHEIQGWEGEDKRCFLAYTLALKAQDF